MAISVVAHIRQCREEGPARWERAVVIAREHGSCGALEAFHLLADAPEDEVRVMLGLR